MIFRDGTTWGIGIFMVIAGNPSWENHRTGYESPSCSLSTVILIWMGTFQHPESTSKFAWPWMVSVPQGTSSHPNSSKLWCPGKPHNSCSQWRSIPPKMVWKRIRCVHPFPHWGFPNSEGCNPHSSRLNDPLTFLESKKKHRWLSTAWVMMWVTVTNE